jgi:biopolymer transport protein TolR
MSRSRSTVDVLSEINITPLIDVMLVLLIIFILVTPVPPRGLDTSLPRPAPPGSTSGPDHPFVLTLERGPDGSALASLNGHPVALHHLESRLLAAFASLPDRTLFVRVAKDLRYGQAVAALDIARGAGVERIGLLGDPQEPVR